MEYNERLFNAKTREEVIAELEAELERLPEEERDVPICVCACAEAHEYSPRSMLAAIKDPNNEDGKAFVEAVLGLSDEFETLEDETK